MLKLNRKSKPRLLYLVKFSFKIETNVISETKPENLLQQVCLARNVKRVSGKKKIK